MTANDEKYPKLNDEQMQYVLGALDIVRGYVIKTYKPRDEEAFENLMAVAYLALVVAASRFDPEKGVKFFTYGRWWVYKLCNEYIGRDHTIVPSWDILRTNEPPEITANVPLDSSEEVRSVLDLYGDEESGFGEVEQELFHEWAMTKVFPNYSTNTISNWQRWKGRESFHMKDDEWACVFLLDDELDEGLK